MKTSRFNFAEEFAQEADIVRAEVLAAISRAFSRADEKGCAVSKQEVLRAADSVLGYYAANE